MNTAQDIARAIIGSNFSNDELNVISQALLFQRNQLSRQNTGTLVRGTRVKWNSPRAQQSMSGTVTKVGRKFITVDTGSGSWRVPASMLEKA